jgi:hypothetical protein
MPLHAVRHLGAKAKKWCRGREGSSVYLVHFVDEIYEHADIVTKMGMID